jgi:hypothetical protein
MKPAILVELVGGGVNNRGESAGIYDRSCVGGQAS